MKFKGGPQEYLPTGYRSLVTGERLQAGDLVWISGCFVPINPGDLEIGKVVGERFYESSEDYARRVVGGNERQT